jgi:transcriptional regulator with XRE-family HTH domain
MDVKIKSRFMIAEREKRAWSQQHLADASVLALRTIQRIEASGTGSYESAIAIAASLDIPVADLRAIDESEPEAASSSRAWKVTGTVVGASLLASVAAFFSAGVFAEQILVDVGITMEGAVGENDALGKDVRNFRTQMVLDDGEEKELPVEGEFNLVIIPSVLDDGKVIVIVKLYEYRDRGLELLAEPRVVTPSGEQTEVLFEQNKKSQRTYRVVIKPQVI